MYYSQYGQDKYLDQTVFNQKEKGFFVDIGAYDGKLFSNTLFFEQQRKWDGICFEPNPAMFEKLTKIRQCTSMQACVGTPKEGKDTVEFMKIDGDGSVLSGIVDNYDERHLERIEKTVTESQGKKEVIQVPVVDLNTVLKKHQIKHVDYVSLDTEGNEWDVLLSIDYKKIKIKAFSIENNYSDNRVYYFMHKKGYRLVKRMEMDEIYVRKNLIRNLIGKLYQVIYASRFKKILEIK